MPTTVHFSTKDRILGAAEELFAQYGFAGTSLRQVTSRADVNIAAVNYHFGSKENLVNEVFRRRMDEMSEQRLTRLKAAVKDHPGDLEPILAAFVEPALAMAQDRHGGGAFIRVIARAYAEKNDGLRKFLSDQYGHVLREFGKAIIEEMGLKDVLKDGTRFTDEMKRFVNDLRPGIRFVGDLIKGVGQVVGELVRNGPTFAAATTQRRRCGHCATRCGTIR